MLIMSGGTNVGSSLGGNLIADVEVVAGSCEYGMVLACRCFFIDGVFVDASMTNDNVHVGLMKAAAAAIATTSKATMGQAKGVVNVVSRAGNLLTFLPIVLYII